MKKTKILTILFSIGLLTLVSAAVVDYLSGTATATVSVDSPMENLIGLTETGEFSESIDLGLTHGGSTEVFWMKTTNLSDSTVSGTVKNLVYNPLGLTCSDFDSVNATTNGGITYDLIDLGLCSEINSQLIQFSYGPHLIVWSSGQIDLTEIEVAFVQGALGEYTFTSKVVELSPTPIP